MSYSADLKKRAILLRKQGRSLSEITRELGIVKSTASVWLSDIVLPDDLQLVIKQKEAIGREKALEARKTKFALQKALYAKTAKEDIATISFSKEFHKLSCALLWWCEGNKDTTMVRFTNSDKTLVKNFLRSLRTGFLIDESKLRVLIHIHEYHDNNTQRVFWSKITDIPLTQFHESYQKPHTGKRRHTNYEGCIAISYYDAKIAKEMEALYNAFTLI